MSIVPNQLTTENNYNIYTQLTFLHAYFVSMSRTPLVVFVTFILTDYLDPDIVLNVKKKKACGEFATCFQLKFNDEC